MTPQVPSHLHLLQPILDQLPDLHSRLKGVSFTITITITITNPFSFPADHQPHLLPPVLSVAPMVSVVVPRSNRFFTRIGLECLR